MRPARSFAALALLLTPALGSAQQPSTARVAPESVGLSSAGLARVGALLEQVVQEQRIAGGVVGVARRGQVVYLAAAGAQDLATRTPMTEQSLFRIYSMSKAVTSVAAMMLWEEGRFQLDDAVSKYIPEFDRVSVIAADGGSPRAAARPITVRDLMLHTSGLNHRTSAYYRDAQVRRRDQPMSTFIENVVRTPLMEDPGTRYRYSEATTVLGRLVEIWSGQTLDVFMQERIFRPLGMNETGFWARPDQRARLTTVYSATENGLTPIELETAPFTERPPLLEGAVGLVSTVPDFLRFSQMLLNGGELSGTRLLKAETVATMTKNGLSDAVQQARGGAMGWGLANVNVLLNPAGVNYPASLGEYGWDGSAGTIFWNDPVEQMVIVAMWQSQPANPNQLRQRIKTLVYEARTN
jgi:CubicO group peptidase (beta-lactamase class C family)